MKDINSTNLCDISFVIITWNSEKYIYQCIRSYIESVHREHLNAEFLIVDNGSKDRTTDIVENDILSKLPADITGRLFRLRKNLGTTISRNIALKAVSGNHIVVCDSDTEFMEGEWKEVFKYLNNSGVGIIAPQLIYPDGKIQNSVKYFPTLTDKVLKLKKIFFNLKAGSCNDFYEDFPWNSPRSVDTAISACWILKKSLLNQVGLLDEKIYYSPEDIDYCLRVWKTKSSVIYYPSLKLIHHTQQISHRKPFSKQSISHLFGLIYYFKKHHYFFSAEKIRKSIGK